LPGQVLEVRSIDGRLRFARKGRGPDQGDQPKKAFDPPLLIYLSTSEFTVWFSPEAPLAAADGPC
jgi:hypothetical protein